MRLDRTVLRVAHRFIASTATQTRAVEAFLRLAANIPGTLGRVVYAEFIAQEVQGLDRDPRIRGARDAHLLRGDVEKQAKAFGHRVYRFLISKFSDPNLVDDVVQAFLVKLLRKGLPLLPQTPLRQAEAYALKALGNEARDHVRKRVRQQHRQRDLDDSVVPELDDPAALKSLEGMLPTGQLLALLRSLEDVHPRAREYVEMLLEGRKPAEVARAWGVSQPYVSKWVRRYGPEIQKTVRRHVEARASRLDLARELRVVAA